MLAGAAFEAIQTPHWIKFDDKLDFTKLTEFSPLFLALSPNSAPSKEKSHNRRLLLAGLLVAAVTLVRFAALSVSRWSSSSIVASRISLVHRCVMDSRSDSSPTIVADSLIRWLDSTLPIVLRAAKSSRVELQIPKSNPLALSSFILLHFFYFPKMQK